MQTWISWWVAAVTKSHANRIENVTDRNYLAIRAEPPRITLTAGAKTGDFTSITRIAQQFVEKIKHARQGS